MQPLASVISGLYETYPDSRDEGFISVLVNGLVADGCRHIVVFAPRVPGSSHRIEQWRVGCALPRCQLFAVPLNEAAFPNLG